MSSAAQKAAPPAKKSLKWSISMIIIGFFCFQGSMGVIAIGLLLIAGGGYLGFISFKYNSEVYPPIYDVWLNSWMCQKCGTIFTAE